MTWKCTLDPVVPPFEDSSQIAEIFRELFSVHLSSSGRGLIATAFLALLGVLILNSAYSLIKTDWPEVYTDTQTRAQEHIRVNPIRTYFLLRGGPVFLVSLFISVSIDRLGGLAWLGFWLMIIIYLCWTTGRATLEVLKTRSHPNWIMLLFYHGLSVIVVVIFGFLAVLLRSLFVPFIPGGQELLISVWAGVFAALLAGVVRQMLSPHRLEGEEVVLALRRDIGPETWSYLRGKAVESEELRDFVTAFVLAETQQRPRWFRRLERLGGKIWGPGTYGVAQVASDTPISDTKSIDILVDILNNSNVSNMLKNEPSYSSIAHVCSGLTNDPAHAGRIYSFYDTVRHMEKSGTLPD